MWTRGTPARRGRAGRAACGALAVALGALAVALNGCAGRAHTSSGGVCQGATAGYPTTRIGLVAPGETEIHWGSQGDPQAALEVTEERRGCAYTVRVNQAGRRYELAGYAYVGDYVVGRTGRLVFVVGDDAHRRAVIDGEPGRSYTWLGETEWRPRFSVNGLHVAYTAQDGRDRVMVVDGREVLRSRGLHGAVFVVLNDGGWAAAARGADGQGYDLVVSGAVRLRFDEVADGSVTTSPDGGRFALTVRRGLRYVAVVDGEPVTAPGVPMSGGYVFSEGDRRCAFPLGHVMVLPAPGAPRVPASGLVLDGRYVPLGDAVPQLVFRGERLVASTDDSRGPRLHTVLEVPTPREAPTADDYRPPPAYAGPNLGARVVLGRSVGPLFDEIESGSLRVAPDGAVSYRGRRAGGSITVVNNVIVPRAGD